MQEKLQNWLLYRLSALGDVLLTTGVMAYWHERAGLTFDVVTKEAFAPVFLHHPAVGTVHAAKDDDLRLPRMQGWFRELVTSHTGWGLVDLHGTPRSRLLAAQWRGPVRRYPKYSLARRLFLASGKRLFRETLLAASVAERYSMAFSKELPPKGALLPRVYLSAEEQAWGLERLAALPGPSGKEYAPVALHPYAAHQHKAWPETHWRRLVEYLDAQGIPWLSMGRGTPLFSGRPEDLTNTSSLRESAALLASCRVLVTGDSGPMHLATAVGTPVVALFGPTTREWGFFPAGPRDRVLERDLPCRPCSLHGKKACPCGGECLASISPEEVFRQLQDFL